MSFSAPATPPAAIGVMLAWRIDFSHYMPAAAKRWPVRVTTHAERNDEAAPEEVIVQDMAFGRLTTPAAW